MEFKKSIEEWLDEREKKKFIDETNRLVKETCVKIERDLAKTLAITQRTLCIEDVKNICVNFYQREGVPCREPRKVLLNPRHLRAMSEELGFRPSDYVDYEAGYEAIKVLTPICAIEIHAVPSCAPDLLVIVDENKQEHRYAISYRADVNGYVISELGLGLPDRVFEPEPEPEKVLEPDFMNELSKT